MLRKLMRAYTKTDFSFLPLTVQSRLLRIPPRQILTKTQK